MFSLGVLDGGLKAKLAKLEAVASAKGELLAVVGATVLTKVQMGFRTGTDPWGNKWKPIKWRAPRMAKGKLSKAGKAQAEANAAGTPGQPLRDTGALNRSITMRVDNDGVTIGTNLKYARVHQFGATIKPKSAKRLLFSGPSGQPIFAKQVTIPARPYLPLTAAGKTVLPPAWRKSVVARLKAHMKEQIKEPA